MNHSLARVRLAPLLVWLLAWLSPASAATDTDRIIAAMESLLDQPGRPLHITPVSVEDGFAIAGWSQGSAGGRALLHRVGDSWQIVLCAGDALLQPATLAGAGMAAGTSARLLEKVQRAEVALTPASRALFSRFNGLVAVGQGTAAPDAGHPTRDLFVTGAWARATPPGTTVGAAYFAITNPGPLADALLDASTPAAARVELHRTEVRDGLSQMRPAGELQIGPGQTLRVAPGGLHVMLTGLTQPLVAGTRVPLTLQFRRGGKLVVDLDVKPLTAIAPDMAPHGDHTAHQH
jgi:periplasmic copper chaperone A